MTKETHHAAVAAIQFALNNPEGMEFLRLWNEGEFDILRRDWPEAPDSVYIGADPLTQSPATLVGVEAVLGSLPAPIDNPEAWPTGYADGFNDCARIAYESVKETLAEQSTTTGITATELGYALKRATPAQVIEYLKDDVNMRVALSIHFEEQYDQQPKHRPYNASGSLSEYGVFPECDVQQPATPSEAVNVIGMPEFDGLLDHIYEYGTAAEGVIEKANAFARAVIARYTPQQPATDPRSTHRVWRGDDWQPCYCEATDDHRIDSEQPAVVNGEAGAFDANFMRCIANLCRAAYDLCQPKSQRTPENPREHYGELCLLGLKDIANVIERRLAAAEDVQSKTQRDARELIAKLAAHVRPTCSELWDEAQTFLAREAE